MTDPGEAPRSTSHHDDPELVPIVGELVRKAVSRLWRRSRREVARAASASKEALALRQKQADLDAFWGRLGRTAYHLVEAGEIDHPALRKAMERIDQLEEEIAAAHTEAPEPLPPP